MLVYLALILFVVNNNYNNSNNTSFANLSPSASLTFNSFVSAESQSNLISVNSNSMIMIDFFVSAESEQLLRLPCKIGSHSNCGLPYIIAWYKFNHKSGTWRRIELPLSAGDTAASLAQGFESRFSFELPTLNQNPGQQQQTKSCLQQNKSTVASSNWQCVFLSIKNAQVFDEGQYKCEVTYAEALDFDKCPQSTASQLTVFGEWYFR